MKKLILLLILAAGSCIVINAQDQTPAKPAASKPVPAKRAKQPKQKATPAVVGLEIGNQAPDLNFQNPDGKPVALSSLRGNIVLLDFWASWCMPCRMENPNVVSAYNKYKTVKFKSAKGFTVYSVSLDRDKGNWVKAIQQDNLSWTTHVSDLQFWSSAAAATYQVQSIPTNWLINEKGIIIAKGLRGPTLDAELDKLVKIN